MYDEDSLVIIGRTADADFKEKRTALANHLFDMPNTKNLALMQKLKGVDPAFAQHVLFKNELIQDFAMKKGSGIDILEQPMCSCEHIGSWGRLDGVMDGKKWAYCKIHGAHTENPITVAEYLDTILGKMTEEEITMYRAAFYSDSFIEGGNEDEL